MPSDEKELVESNLNSVKIEKYLDVRYSKLKLFKRALLVFRSSYYGYESLSDNASYQAKFSQFVSLMKKVFHSAELSNVNVKALLEEIDKELEESHLVVHIRVVDHKIVGRDFVRLVVRSNIDQVKEMPLNGETYSGRRDFVSFKVPFSQLKCLREEKKVLQIELNTANEQGRSCLLPNKLVLPYLSIHPEGYRTWFDFDSDVKCLVTIRFSIKCPYSGSRLSLTEHTQLIWHLFKYRFSENAQSNSGVAVLESHHNPQRTNCMHRVVNPNSSEAFWPSRTRSNSEVDSVNSDSPSCAVRSIHCHELELAYDEDDDPMEEEFCRCTEWCNVSAFYYHNPIFRFLMVQFTNCYIKANATLPSSYMCAISYLFAESSKSQIPISLLYILNSVLSYMKLSYSKKIQFLAIDVCSYRFLRQVDINKLATLMQDHEEPFSPQLLVCINNYYRIFAHLHSHIGKIQQQVPFKFIDAWYDQLYEVIYKGYNSYLLANTQAAFHSFRNYSSIPLFERFNCLPKWTNFDFDIEKVIHNRDIICTNFNPLFVQFNCHPCLRIIYNISKFIVEIYQTLSDSEKKSPKCYFALLFDKLLSREMSIVCNNENNHLVLLRERSSTVSQTSQQPFVKKLYMLFTLKLYSFAFCIQQYLSNSITSYNRTACNGHLIFLPENLNFVFDSDWVERQYSQSFPMESIFANNCVQFEHEMCHFYQSVWPQTNVNLLDPSTLISGIIEEYCKLCLWWDIDGPRLRVFQQLLHTPIKLVDDCITRADHLFVYEFGFVDTLENEIHVKCLMKDDIVANIVNAACFTLVKIVCSIIKSIHRTQKQKHIKHKVDLILARPGIIEFMATLGTVRICLDRLRALFLAFNDQSDSIGRSIEVAEFTITGMYCDLYVKISHEWICQVKRLIEEFGAKGSKRIAIVLHLILIVGIHFVMRFHRFFRCDCMNFKNDLIELEDELRKLKWFNYDKYKTHFDEMCNFEINCSGDKPFLCESLKMEIYELLSIETKSKSAFESLKQFKVDISKLV